MLAKKFLLTKKDIKAFSRSKTRLCAGSVVCLRFRRYLTANTEHRSVRYGELPITRWAFVVSSKIRKNAIARNITRRRMAEIARYLQPKIIPGLELVFFISLQDKKALSTKRLRNDIIQIFQQCGVL